MTKEEAKNLFNEFKRLEDESNSEAEDAFLEAAQMLWDAADLGTDYVFNPLTNRAQDPKPLEDYVPRLIHPYLEDAYEWNGEYYFCFDHEEVGCGTIHHPTISECVREMATLEPKNLVEA